jgi:hypothetical protein
VAVDNEPPAPDCPRWFSEPEREDDYGDFDGFDELGSAEPSWDSIDQEEFLAADVESPERDDPESLAELTGVIAETVPPGPRLAGWLSGQDPETASGRDLIGMAEGFRRVASWAQAGELTMVAQVASRSAAADPRAGLAPDGRPALLTEDATAQVSLGLTLSHTGAEAWTGLAVALRWRLPRTAAALAEGLIDSYRAKILAEAVIPLSDEAARAVEDRVIPLAGDLTYAQMHSAVRRAVIAADPEGAEHRRAAAERRTKVSLYPDQDGTATLVGARLPAAAAAAAFAMVCAIANAMKAAGAGGGIHFLRSQALIGLILGTLPPIPPPVGGPPDADPPPEDDDDGWSPPDDGTPPGEADGTDPAGSASGAGPADSRGTADKSDATGPDGTSPADGSAPADSADGTSPADGPGAADKSDGTSSTDGSGPAGRTGGTSPSDNADCADRVNGDGGTDAADPDEVSPGEPPGPAEPPPDPAPATDPWPQVPPLTDADLPEDDGYRDAGPPMADGYADWDPARDDPLEDHFARPDAQWAWPPIPPAVPVAPRSAGAASDPAYGPATRPQRSGGLVDLTLPWATLTGAADSPGLLGRIGPVTAVQARQIARLAGRGYQTQWRVILTDARGRCVAVTRVPRIRPPAGPEALGVTDVVGRVTVVLPAAELDPASPSAVRRSVGIYAEILSAARRALSKAREKAAADQGAAAGCAHTEASTAYQPPPRIREYVAARDLTCRYPSCGQPAWRGDLDHTRPWDQGGLTCPCNMGALCRRHHRLKQLRGWDLAQARPGMFRWVTPAGRAYAVQPDLQPS